MQVVSELFTVAKDDRLKISVYISSAIGIQGFVTLNLEVSNCCFTLIYIPSFMLELTLESGQKLLREAEGI